eukprot:TRINITY_DN1010_c0_g2_i2.p2 TRINITY_DN1010_c0_g2~~TRINITY_DN1010_c0_g2_i2.p2  ORF type:complete len:169 (+),score=28.21 TRINITY_DN1010_c0_g2_i2:119-625(+)
MCIRDSINAEYGEPRFTSCLSAWMSVSPDRVAAPIPNNARADTGRREEVSDSRNTRMGDSIVSLEASLHSAEQSLKKEKTRREHMERLATTAVPHSPIDGPSAVKNARVSVGTMLAINQLGTQSRVRCVVALLVCEKMTGGLLIMRSASRQWRSIDARRTSARNLRLV